MTHTGTDPQNTTLSPFYSYINWHMTHRGNCMPSCFPNCSLCESTTETAVLLNRPTDGSAKKICEWVTMWCSVQEGHEWHFIVRQRVSSKAVMLQWAQGLCNKRRVSTRECWWPDAVCWEMSGEAEKVQIQRKAIVSSCAIKTKPPWFHRVPPSSLTPAISRRFSLTVDKFAMTIPI